MPNVKDLFSQRSDTRRTLDPAKRAEGIAKVISFRAAIRNARKRDLDENKPEQDPQTDKDDIRAGDNNDNSAVRRQWVGQFDDTEPAETNGGERIERFIKRVFLRDIPDERRERQ